MSNKKLYVVVAILVIAATILSACGTAKPTASTGGTPVEAVARQLQHFSCWWGRPCVADPRSSAGRGFAVNFPG